MIVGTLFEINRITCVSVSNYVERWHLRCFGMFQGSMTRAAALTKKAASPTRLHIPRRSPAPRLATVQAKRVFAQLHPTSIPRNAPRDRQANNPEIPVSLFLSFYPERPVAVTLRAHDSFYSSTFEEIYSHAVNPPTA